MGMLWVNFAVVYTASLASRYFSHPLDREPYVRPNRLLIVAAMASLVVIAGLRRNIGDTYFYRHSYEIGDFNLAHIDFTGDFGFYIFQTFLHYVSDNPQILVFTTALMTNVLIVLVLANYSRAIELSLFVYIALGMFTVSMNGIRQSLAAAIIFAGTKYLLNGDWKKFMFLVLLAATFHRTALIFIPVYFIVRRKAWTKVTFMLLLIAVVIAFQFETFQQLLFNALNDTQYGHYSHFNEGGASMLRAAVTGVPLFIAFLGRKKLRELWPKSDTIVNLALLGFVFMVVATQNWIFARFDIYFGLFGLILISWITQLFVGRDRQFVYYGMIVCYFIFFYYEQVITLGIDYRSDYLNW